MEFLVLMGFVAVVAWIVRSVMQPGVDVIEEGRRAAGRLADHLREHEVRTPPGPRSTPQVVRRTGAAAAPRRSDASARRAAANAAGATSAATPARPATARKPSSTARRDTRLDDWHLLLDVPLGASRREIHEALRLRMARARADGDGDGETVRRLMRAAATGIAQPRDRDDD